MNKTYENRFVFKGEIAELLSKQSSVKAKIICKPGTILIEVPDINNYELGDEVLVTGVFTCEKIENLHYRT